MKLGKKTATLAGAYRVDHGKSFRLKGFDPAHTLDALDTKEQCDALLEQNVVEMADLQDKLYAQDQWALLLIFQAMDAAGKDGVIKHVFSGVNPQGCEVSSFKVPSAEELDHDFLWRATKRLPERGRIGIFNRSYYEEVLVVRVHPELLEKQKLPKPLLSKRVWQQRFEDINAFERYLTRNGIAVLKIFLHLSKKEQKRRFMERLTEANKNWKFSTSDVQERQHWDVYQEAYEDMIRHTANQHAPWYVVPADNKWFTRLVVAAAVVHALDGMNLKYPKVDAGQKAELEKARQQLENE